VLDSLGQKFRGVLKSVDGSLFTITVAEKVKEEGMKRPEWREIDHEFDMEKVKYTKYMLNFK